MPASPLPPLPRVHVARTRLVRSVRPDVPVVCVVAGAGWGKSVLLRELARRTDAPERRVAWVDLDPSRSEARRFWQSILRAIGAALDDWPEREAIEALLGPLDVSVDPGQLTSSLLAELTEMTAAGRRLTLVVDDLHLLHDHHVRDAFADFADQVPDGVQVLVGTRQEPAFPLAAWRLRGRVDEVREAQLRYNADEVRALVSGVVTAPVSADVVSALLEETEGWPAGVQFHALAARGRRDRPLAELLQHSRHLSHEYLLEEVLGALSPDLRSFVLDTAVLDVLSEEACRAVIGDEAPDDVLAVLEELERSGVFTSRTGADARRFRYHHLFRELLRSELARTDRRRWEQVHRRAATHLAATGDPLRAVDHLLEVLDPVAAFAVLTEHHRSIVESPSLTSLRSRVARFPPSFVRSDPAAALDLAVLTATCGRPSTAVHLLTPLRHVELDGPLADRRTWLDLAISGVTGEFARVVDLIGQRPAAPPDGIVANFWREIPLTLVLADRFDESDDEWRRGAAGGVLDDVHPIVVLAARAFMEAWRGRVRDAAVLVEEARRRHDETLPQMRASFLRVPCAASLVRMQTGDPVAAARVVERFLADIDGMLERHTTYDVPLAVVALRAWRLAGEPWRAFERTVPLVDSLPGVARPWLMSLVAEELVRCACDLGDVPAAERALGHVRGAVANPLARAHVLLARGESVAARAALAELDRDQLAARSPARALDLAVLQHLTATTSRDRAVSLDAAEVLAEQHGLHRSLDMALRRSVRTAVPSAPATLQIDEPLTVRELDVLRLLPTDLPNAELAEELFVSVNTLKTHMKSVYRKLGVTTRAEAVARASELGLVSARTHR